MREIDVIKEYVNEQLADLNAKVDILEERITDQDALIEDLRYTRTPVVSEDAMDYYVDEEWEVL